MMKKIWKVSSMANQALNSSTTSSFIQTHCVSALERWGGFKNGGDLVDAEEIKKRWKNPLATPIET